MVKNGEIIGAVVTFSDTSEEEKVKENLEKLAHNDYLTGLSNRICFEESLEKEITHAEKNNHMFALLYIDLDDFKNVNDSLGHRVGDLLLKAVGNRMVKITRASDLVARIGGDEFAIIMKNIKSPYETGLLANKIIKHIGVEYKVMNYSVSLGASVGIACYPFAGFNTSTLTRHADIALYKAKSKGYNHIHYFTEELGKEYKKVLKLESNLHQAIRNKEICLVYQPQIELHTKKMIGLEALLRWHSPELGKVEPYDFIPIIEKDSHAEDIYLWMIQIACEQYLKLPIQVREKCKLAINISPAQLLKPGFVEALKNLFSKLNVNAERLVFEVTETGIMTQLNHIEKKLRQLHALGAKLAIDDFGTGYSSLSRLNSLPIDILKLDPYFVKGIAEQKSKAKVVKSIIDLAHSLNKEVIAEGLETEAQINTLIKLGCHFGQGFYFAKPMSETTLLHMADKIISYNLKFGGERRSELDDLSR